MRKVFRGIVIKTWKVNDFHASEDRKYNKITVKESVLFYAEYWIDRCKVIHDEEEQNKRLIQWHRRVLNEMLNSKIKERRFVERTRLHIDRAPNKSI